MTDTGNDGANAIAAAADVVRELLQRETDRKNSLEQRGIIVITTSSTLATLVFAIATLVTKSKSAQSLIGSEKVFIIIGLVLFVTAGILGIMINAPRAGVDITADEAKTYLTLEDQADVVRSAAVRFVETLRWRRTANLQKGRLLIWAVSAEVAAVSAVAVAVLIIVARLPQSQ